MNCFSCRRNVFAVLCFGLVCWPFRSAAHADLIFSNIEIPGNSYSFGNDIDGNNVLDFPMSGGAFRIIAPQNPTANLWRINRIDIQPSIVISEVSPSDVIGARVRVYDDWYLSGRAFASVLSDETFSLGAHPGNNGTGGINKPTFTLDYAALGRTFQADDSILAIDVQILINGVPGGMNRRARMVAKESDRVTVGGHLDAYYFDALWDGVLSNDSYERVNSASFNLNNLAPALRVFGTEVNEPYFLTGRFGFSEGQSVVPEPSAGLLLGLLFCLLGAVRTSRRWSAAVGS